MYTLKDKEFKYIQKRNPGYNKIVCSLPSTDEQFEEDFERMVHRYLTNLIQIHKKTSGDVEQITQLCCLLNDMDNEDYI